MMKMLYRERSSYQKGGVGGFEFEHLPPFVSLRYTRPRVWLHEPSFQNHRM